LRFARDVCLQFDAALGRHWLETDGLGGYASSTLFLCPTSRYDGLLVAPSREQAERHVFLSRFEETFRGEGQEFPISDARYGGSFGPGGHRFVHHCDFATRPRFTYRIGHVEVVREVQMVRGRPVVLLRYEVTGQRTPLELRLRPLFPCRRADSLTWRNDELDGTVAGLGNGIAVQPYAALPQVAVTLAVTPSSGGGFEADATWFQGLEYSDDIRRGYDGHEDQWSPGELRVALESGAEVVVAVTIGEPVEDPAALWRRESGLREVAPAGTGVRGMLEAAAEHYLYRADGGRPGVIAGYPWFGEWGRDTLIALPGLTLARGRVEECGDVLSGLLPFLRDGRLPNVFGPTPDESDYRAVDPAMWFARAVRLYAAAGGTEDRLRDELLPALVKIADAHRASCTDDGLLRAGSPEVATTWMDAVIDGRPVTPRHGLAVEVNALWYQLLDTLSRRSEGSAARSWKKQRKKTGDAFVRRFWIEKKQRLADRVADGVPDDTVRPNIVIAAALDPSPLSREQRIAVVDLVRAELLTRRGLRTLSPRYLRYRGRFEGDQRTRDDAYHQGTVWPWLLGFYVEASLRAYGATKLVKKRLRVLLDGFEEHLGEHGVGHVSEVFDGDPPQRPGGCYAQAWSVAELLRAYTLLDAGGE
jgi:predicted glycogen debranching enzyme